MSDNAETVCPTCKGKGRIEVIGDKMQGMTHNIYDGRGTVTYPRTLEPRKTWLDECAMMALGVMYIAMVQGYWTPGENPNKELAEASYQIATAMLAEKIKREAKE